MAIAKVTSKGQVTLPIKVRKKLGLKTGSYLAFDSFGDDYILKAMPVDPLDELEGFCQYNGPSHTVDEMNAAILKKAGTLHRESVQK